MYDSVFQSSFYPIFRRLLIFMTIIEIAKYYTYFYSKIFNSPKYDLVYSETSLSVAQNFIRKLNFEFPNANEELLWNYCVFQFMYYSSMEMKNDFTNKPIFAHVFGGKAYERFCDRDTTYDWMFIDSEFVKQHKLLKTEIRLNQHYITVNKGFDSEEMNKEQFMKNDTDHFYNCMDYTTLFKSDSLICAICKYQIACKQLLKDNYPDLFKLRKLK